MTDHVAQLAKTLYYDPYAITTDNDTISRLADPLDKIATTIDQMSGDLGMSGIGADAASASLAQLSVDLRGHSDTVGQFAKIAAAARDAVGTAYDGYFDLPAGALTAAQEKTYVANDAGTAITYIDQEMQQERQSAAAKVLATLDSTISDQIAALKAAQDPHDSAEQPGSGGSPSTGGASSLPATPAATVHQLPAGTPGGSTGGTAGGGSHPSDGGTGPSTGIVGVAPGTHGGGSGDGTGGGQVSVDGPTTGIVPGLGSGGSAAGGPGSGIVGGAAGGSTAGGWAGGLAGALTVGGGALGSRLSGALAASTTANDPAGVAGLLGGPRTSAGTALSGGVRGGTGSSLRAAGTIGAAGEGGDAAAARSGGTLVGSAGAGSATAQPEAAGARSATPIGGMPGGGAAGSSRSRRRAGSLGYLAPELDDDDAEPTVGSAGAVGMRAGSREQPVDVEHAEGADDTW